MTAWYLVTAFEGEQDAEMLDMMDEYGAEEVIDHMAMWDYGLDTRNDAFANGHVIVSPCYLSGMFVRVIYSDKKNYALVVDYRSNSVELYAEDID